MDQYCAETVRSRLDAVRERLAEAAKGAGRKPGDVTLLAVSKYHPASAVAEAHKAGQRLFGENYIQEALAKQDELENLDIYWHFIGRLQSNKAKFAAGRFDLVHTVDSLKLARTLHKKALDRGVTQPVLIQVNIGSEPQKSGVDPEALEKLMEEASALEGIRMRGLMCMPPFFDDPERSRPYFARLRELRDDVAGALALDLPELSMGMSGDCVQAVEEGATIVRVGTDIFGQRPCKTQG